MTRNETKLCKIGDSIIRDFSHPEASSHSDFIEGKIYIIEKLWNNNTKVKVEGLRKDCYELAYFNIVKNKIYEIW